MVSYKIPSLREVIELNSENNRYKIEIELILQRVLKCKKIDIYLNKDLILDEEKNQIINDYIKQLKKGKPIQYILNNAPFFGRNFFVDKNVLIPRFDTELIIDILLKQSPCNSLLEIGTGSGNIAITIAEENLAKYILATDICKKKISIAKHNKKKLSPQSNIEFILDDFFNTNINQKFDVIVSNPPYIPKLEINNLNKLVRMNEPLDSLTDGDDGYSFYKHFALCGKIFLNKNGFMLLEIGINNKLNELYEIFSDFSLEVFKDLNEIPRVLKVF